MQVNTRFSARNLVRGNSVSASKRGSPFTVIAFANPSAVSTVTSTRQVSNVKTLDTKHVQSVSRITKAKLQTASFGTSAQKANQDNADKGALMCKAAFEGNLALVKTQVDSGIDPNVSDYDKRTALHLAAAEGRSEIVAFLLERGALVNPRDRFGRTPLDDAVIGNHQAVVDVLNKFGAKAGSSMPMTLDKSEVQRRLIESSSQGSLEDVKRCLSMGAEVNAGDYDNRTALHLAAAEGHAQVVEFLLTQGANVNSLDRFGNTPLQDALRKRSGRHDAVSKILEKHGAILNREVWRLRQSPEFFSSIQKALPLLCERGNWEYAEVWLPNTEDTVISSSENWFAEKSAVNKYTALRQHSTSLAFTSKDTNAVARAWSTHKPVWIDRAKDNLIHVKKTADLSANTGLALPVVFNDKVLAVLLFLSPHTTPEDHGLVARFQEFSTGLIKAGFSQTLDHVGSGEQMNVVYNNILEEGVFNATLIYQELDWYYNNLGLQQYYFERFSATTIAKHLHSFIAAKKLAQATGQPEDVRVTLQQKDGSSAFYVCPADHDSLVHVENKVENLIKNLPADKAYTLTFFRTKGTAIPGGSTHLGLYIFDTAEYVEKDPAPTEQSIWKLATGVFLRDKSPMIRERYQETIKKTHGRLSPALEVFPEYRDGTIPLMFAFKMGANQSYMSQITELIKHNNIVVERKFIETFANGMVFYSLYIRPVEKAVLNELLDQVSLLHAIPRSSLTDWFLHSKCSAEEYAYASAATRCIYYFLSKPSEEFNMLAKVFKDDPLNMGRLSLLQTTLRRDAISQERIMRTLTEYPEIWAKLFKQFETIVTSATRPAYSKEIPDLIKKEVADDLDMNILLAFHSFNSNVLKTNFYKRKKSCLSFRMDPQFMADSGYPQLPFGVFFLMSTDFQGFHVRFRDVARGGIRIITSANEENYTRNLETQFDETYNLAFTQNKKNKDIPEFGSKGTLLLNWNPVSQKNKFLSFQKYIAGLLDLIIPFNKQNMEQTFIPVDHYGKPEILFLGPDEGTADYMQWAAEYAQRRNYSYPLALTTGKPVFMGGVPHDKYGMTTRSVHRYVTGCLQKAGLKEEQVTKLQTGGPDGDLGSNEILMSCDKTIGIVDGSGVVFDPNGIDRTELVRLAKIRKMISDFDTTKLTQKGFRVLVSDKDVKLPHGELVSSGFTFRNEFHLNPISSADLFVPCGGRPESVNLKNVKRMFKQDGSPRFKFIIEGANLFLTPDARMVLEQSGVVVFKDASTNKGGVTSSSFEVLAALALNPEEHAKHMQVKDENNTPKFYQEYVKEIMARIEENAALEFELIWKEHELTKTPRYILTDKISDKINQFNDAVQSSNLWENPKIRVSVMSKALPKTLLNLLGLEEALKRIPPNYAKAIFGAYIASRYVYKYGLSAPEFAFFEFVENSLLAEKK